MDGDTLAVVWIFYALESLLQTKVGENFSSIVRRLALLLGLAEQEISALRKQLRVLYDLRSKIVHGGFEVMHPMQNEVLDKRVQQRCGDLLDAGNYGHAILVSSIQKMVEKGWFQPRFDEVIFGEGSVP